MCQQSIEQNYEKSLKAIDFNQKLQIKNLKDSNEKLYFFTDLIKYEQKMQNINQNCKLWWKKKLLNKLMKYQICWKIYLNYNILTFHIINKNCSFK